MRCPKCGYISFDHLETCLKCKKDIKSVSDVLSGTVFNVQTPSFLKFEAGSSEGTLAEDMDMFGDESAEEEDYVDDDLEILMDGEDLESEADFEIDEDEEDGEIELDLSQFETDPDEDVATVSLDMPEELADISDLAPPKNGEVVEEESLGLDLDDLELDMDDGDFDGESSSGSGGGQEVELALDDIDFSETLADEGSDASNKPAAVDMEEDLNFDLDLGGLSIHKDV